MFIYLFRCDYRNSEVELDVEIQSIHSYGHLPGELVVTFYSSLFRFIIYSFLLGFYTIRFFQYPKEIHSIHYLIQSLIASFLIDSVIELHSIYTYNSVGTLSSFTQSIHSIVNCFTRAFFRIMLIYISMG